MVSKVVDQLKERLKMLLLLWKREVQYFASLFRREVDPVGLENVTDEFDFFHTEGALLGTGIVNYHLFRVFTKLYPVRPPTITNLYGTLREFTAFTGNYRSIQIFTGIYGILREFTDH
jgi:hypothetical protein